MLTAEIHRQNAAQKRRDAAQDKPFAKGYAPWNKTARAANNAATGARKEYHDQSRTFGQ